MPIKLSEYVGKHISEICENLASDEFNMCAHFVSHIPGLKFGYTCRAHSGNALSPSTNIRVQEVFAQCIKVSPWDDKPLSLLNGLIFVTASHNAVDLKKKVFGNIPKKHVGIFVGQNISHCSNARKMALQQEFATFSNHMINSYGIVKTYYGSFPMKSNAGAA
jgi:hypothetical protein